MKNLLKKLTFGLTLLLTSCDAVASCNWPAWQQFKQYYVNEDGRVIDASNAQKITTSEGQSYGLFFALVANDRPTFNKLLQWTENNLAAGDLKTHLPAWLWGKNSQQKWTVLDSNSASDADLWIAYDLLEAGRLWNNRHYSSLGKSLLQRIANEEIVDIPQLGTMLLPGKIGFVHGDNWRLNPSYLPLQVLTKFSLFPGPWKNLEKNSLRLLIETAPQGFSPDWIIWNKQKGWQADSKHPNSGSYDAIRVYLWAGMLADDNSEKNSLLKQLQPMVTVVEKNNLPPEKINVVNGEISGNGSAGFSAALLPLLANNSAALATQRQRVSPLQANDYYNSVLKLFGQGWDQHYYRFNRYGELLPLWNKQCADQK